MFKLFFVLCLSVCTVIAKNEIYDDYIIYEVSVQDLEQGKLVHQIQIEMVLDLWSYPTPRAPGQILVSKVQKEEFENRLSAHGIQYRVFSDNIREQIALEEQMLAAAAAKSNRTGRGLSFDEIHSYETEIYGGLLRETFRKKLANVDRYLVQLGQDYPDTVTTVSGGRSFEGRDIKYLKISTTNFQDRTKPIVMIMSMLHAREWITLPATLYAIQKLVIDVTEQDLLQEIDWIILPIANPDGYEFSHTSNRFWRKNRATGLMVGDVCVGVDLNRNFDIFWGTASSNLVCADTFHGRSPFSESETAVIRDIIGEYGYRMEMYSDIHSFGSMILYGFGNGNLPANVLTLHLVGVNMAQAVDRVKMDYNPNYIVGNIFHVLYAASGGSSDYATGMGVPYSHTYELPGFRGAGQTLAGFLVDTDFIEQAGYETWEGLKVGARFARDNFRRRNGY